MLLLSHKCVERMAAPPLGMMQHEHPGCPIADNPARSRAGRSCSGPRTSRTTWRSSTWTCLPSSPRRRPRVWCVTSAAAAHRAAKGSPCGRSCLSADQRLFLGVQGGAQRCAACAAAVLAHEHRARLPGRALAASQRAGDAYARPRTSCTCRIPSPLPPSRSTSQPTSSWRCGPSACCEACLRRARALTQRGRRRGRERFPMTALTMDLFTQGMKFARSVQARVRGALEYGGGGAGDDCLCVLRAGGRRAATPVHQARLR
jgi:hypothetical protein